MTELLHASITPSDDEDPPSWGEAGRNDYHEIFSRLGYVRTRLLPDWALRAEVSAEATIVYDGLSVAERRALAAAIEDEVVRQAHEVGYEDDEHTRYPVHMGDLPLFFSPVESGAMMLARREMDTATGEYTEGAFSLESEGVESVEERLILLGGVAVFSDFLEERLPPTE